MQPGQFPATPLWWEIVYLGGVRVRGTTAEEWAAAPAANVLVVRQPVAATYVTAGLGYHFTIRAHSCDYYWLDAAGLIQQGNAIEAVEAPAAMVKRGVWAERDEFREAFLALGDDVMADERAS